MQISKNLHVLRHDFRVPVSPDRELVRFVYSMLIFGDAITLVDSGVKGSQDRIFDYIQKQGRRIEEVSTLILSHSHPDHIGSARPIKALTGCKVLAHRSEQTWIERPEIQNLERPVPGFFDLVDGPIEVDGGLDEGQEFALASDLTLRCFHTPGHSRGSMSFLAMEDRVFFSGDSIPLEKDIPNYEDFHDLKRSVERIKGLEAMEVLISSWMEPVQGGSRIQEVVERGEGYLAAIDLAVKKHYASPETSMDSCQKVLADLELPAMFALPMVHKAFLSHL